MTQSHDGSTSTAPPNSDSRPDDAQSQKVDLSKRDDPPQAKTSEQRNESLLRAALNSPLLGKGSRLFMTLFARYFGSTAAQKAAGRKNPRERLVRHGGSERERQTLKRLLRALWRRVEAALWFAAPFIAWWLWREPGQTLGDYLLHHLAILLLPALPIAARIRYMVRNHLRTHPPKPSKGSKRKQREPRPALPPAYQHGRDINDIVANLDHLPLRIIYLAGLVAATIIAGRMYPLDVDTFRLIDGDDPNSVRAVLIPLVAPCAVFALIQTRCAYIVRRRFEEIEDCYTEAKAHLGYIAKLPTHPTARQVQEATPWLAVSVKKWWALYEIDRAFVMAPEKLSTSKVDAWDEFATNLNTKLPRPEEWRIRRDPKGRGAIAEAANYPTAVLWDGEYDPDPLTFYVGINLETGARQYLTLGEASPHVVLSGATSSGKTSLAEIIAAQNLLTPMPWDPSLRGIVVIVDPKGPLAKRWAGRPGVVVANGNRAGVNTDDDGRAMLGEEVMADLMRWLVAEQKRREAVLDSYHGSAATWVDLPNEVKREHRFVPITVILDEYLEHTAKQDPAGDEEVERAEVAHDFIHSTATKQSQRYRNVGMHSIVIAQRANMNEIGSRLMTNMPVRAVTGQIDDPQLRTMFATDSVPTLPSTRRVIENGEPRKKTIPGRARIMNALGQEIHKVQVPYFGGKENSETLDKWLPIGDVPENGDFTIPEGQPVVLDEDGNPVEPEAIHHPTKNEPDIETALAPELSDPEDVEDDEQERDLVDGDDDDAVFPAARREVKVCQADQCVENATKVCTQCEKSLCARHVQYSPTDPDDVVCGSCRAGHALVQVRLDELYEELAEIVDGTTLSIRYAISPAPAEGATRPVTVEVRTDANRKVVQIDGDGEQRSVRSKSGTVTNDDDVEDRAVTVVRNYLENAS